MILTPAFLRQKDGGQGCQCQCHDDDDWIDNEKY